MPTAPCTLTDHIAPRTHILTSTSITLERESHLNRGAVPENDDSRRKHDEVEEPLVSHSSMNMDPSPSRCIPTTDITAMMTQQATRDLEQQGINLRPTKTLFCESLTCPERRSLFLITFDMNIMFSLPFSMALYLS